MNTPTLNQFTAWIKTHRHLAVAAVAARRFAETERQRVDAYIKPIFDEYGFVDEQGRPIATPRDLYLSKDEAKCAAFYEECDKAHRAHGFDGKPGYCPALIAEHKRIEAERALIEAGCTLLGIEDVHRLEDRRKMIDLFLGACLGKGAR